MMRVFKVLCVGFVFSLLISCYVHADVVLFRNGAMIGSSTYSDTADTMTSEVNPDNAYGDSCWPLVVRGCGSGIQCTALLKFGDLGDYLPNGFVVQSARIGLSSFYKVTSPLDVKVSEMLKPWNSSSLTWNVDGTGDAWASGGGLGTIANGSISPDRSGIALDTITVGTDIDPQETVWFNIDPQIVQKWVDNDNLNYGLIFYCDQVTANSFSIVGKIASADWIPYRPQLEVTGVEVATCEELWTAGGGVAADLNKDCYFGLGDFIVMANEWLECNDPIDPTCSN